MLKTERVLINEEWMKQWLDAMAWFRSELFSDHAFGVVHWFARSGYVKRGFKYSNMWGSCPQFEKVVQDVWS